ncbi:MAG: ACP phosphodiesterase [Planctomycetota bacterium]|nr:ACP phosphodiesterase [Planctomycetota bacterium]
MNFLAHLLLAPDTPAGLAGNLGGDFLSPHELPTLAPEVQAGIRRHHEVDTFTDTHPDFRASCARVPAPFARYAGILVDVYYDHLLSLRWAAYASEPLDAFIARVERTLLEHAELAPVRLREVLPYMVEQGWLGSYADPEGLRSTLRRIGRRFRKPAPLDAAVDGLLAEREAYLADFECFFPQLLAAFPKA